MLISPTHHVGVPTQIGPLTIFPVWTDAPQPRRGLRTTLPRGATIGEIDGGSMVDRLVLHNPTDKKFLLPGGSIFGGGWQHRVLVHGVLVEAGVELELDVRCVEQGRWGGSRRQRLRRQVAPLAVQGVLRGVHRRSTDRDPQDHDPLFADASPTCGPAWDRARADQHEVWDRVELYQRSFGPSPTSSLVEVTDRLDLDTRRVMDSAPVLPGQRGVVIGIAGHPVLLEVFDHPRTFADQWEAIVASALVDAHRVPARPTPGRRVRAFVNRVSGRRLEPWADAGAATAVESRDDLVKVDGIATGAGEVLHLSVLNARHELVTAT